MVLGKTSKEHPNKSTVTIGDDSTLSGSPNTTASTGTPSWSNVTFFIPSTTSSSHDIGFANSTTSGEVSTTGFLFYSQVVLHSDDGEMATLWYATPTDIDGVWSLKWNATDDDSTDNVLVNLKATAPTSSTEER
jgi:hypothetical protein